MNPLFDCIPDCWHQNWQHLMIWRFNFSYIMSAKFPQKMLRLRSRSLSFKTKCEGPEWCILREIIRELICIQDKIGHLRFMNVKWNRVPLSELFFQVQNWDRHRPLDLPVDNWIVFYKLSGACACQRDEKDILCSLGNNISLFLFFFFFSPQLHSTLPMTQTVWSSLMPMEMG